MTDPNTEPETTAEATAEVQPPTEAAAPETGTEVVEGQQGDAAPTEAATATKPPQPSAEDPHKGLSISERRARAGAEGGLLEHLAPEDKELLRKSPHEFYRIKAEADAYRKLVESGVVSPRTEPKQENAENESEAAMKAASERIEYAISRNPDMTTAEYHRLFMKEMRVVVQAEAREIARKEAGGVYSTASKAEQERTVKAAPEMQNLDFRLIYSGIRTEWESDPNRPKLTPFQQFHMAKERWAGMFPEAPVNKNGHGHAPSVSISDTKRAASSPPAPALSGRDKWLRSDGAKRAGLLDD